MTHLELDAAAAELGLDQTDMAKLLRVGYRDYQDWDHGVTPVPGIVSALVELLLYFDTAKDILRANNECE